MAAPTSSKPFGVTGEDGKPCKCDAGWKCEITETEPSKAGKAFANCAGTCTCITMENIDAQKVLESLSAPKAYCKCEKGQSCVVSKTEGAEAGKIFFECGEGCICVIDHTNAVKVACA